MTPDVNGPPRRPGPVPAGPPTDPAGRSAGAGAGARTAGEATTDNDTGVNRSTPTTHDATATHDPVTASDATTAHDTADDRVPGSVGGSADASDVLAGVEEDALSVARRERDEYLDTLRRLQADFENYKKRMLRQQTDQLERATEDLVAKLLPALDAFDLARAHLQDEEGPSPEVKSLLQASGLVDDVLAKEGLERIGDPGAPFDPTVHDAVEHAPAPPTPGDETRDGAGGSDPALSGPVVADVLRPGYRWKGRVIRPAMVRVRG